MVNEDESYDKPARTKCPFYGFGGVRGTKILMDSEGNQCPFVNSYSPCAMERDGQEPCWDDCEFYNTNENRPLVEKLLGSHVIFPNELDCSISLRKWYDHIVNGQKI